MPSSRPQVILDATVEHIHCDCEDLTLFWYFANPLFRRPETGSWRRFWYICLRNLRVLALSLIAMTTLAISPFVQDILSKQWIQRSHGERAFSCLLESSSNSEVLPPEFSSFLYLSCRMFMKLLLCLSIMPSKSIDDETPLINRTEYGEPDAEAELLAALCGCPFIYLFSFCINQ